MPFGVRRYQSPETTADEPNKSLDADGSAVSAMRQGDLSAQPFKASVAQAGVLSV
jgi:hypothetical protein